jgi:hypothetical protein
MQHYTDTLYDTFGNAISGATVNVYAAGTVTPSTIYSDNLGTSATNPLTTGSDGSFDFYAANGRYDLVITHPSHTFSSADTAGISLFDPFSDTATYLPTLSCSTPGNLAVTYATRYGVYRATGKKVDLWVTLITATMTHTTASGSLSIDLPSGYPAADALHYISGTLAMQGDTLSNVRSMFSNIGYNGASQLALAYTNDSRVIFTVTVTDHTSGGNNLSIYAHITYWTS